MDFYAPEEGSVARLLNIAVNLRILIEGRVQAVQEDSLTLEGGTDR
jgi:hypothetical protein